MMVVKKHRIHTKRNALLFVGVAAIAALIIIVVGVATGRKSTVHITGSNLAYYIDDEQYVFNNEPYICDNAVYLPAEEILSVYGYTCKYDNDKKELTATKDNDTAYIYVDKNTVKYGKDTHTFEGLPSMRRGGVVYIPSQMMSAFTKDEFVFDGEFKFVERPYRDLMENVSIDNSHRIKGDVSKYNGVYVVGDKAAMELLYYPKDNCISYAKVINSIADALPSVQVYNVVIPTMTEFYGPEELYTDQIKGIKTIYENLNENVMPVNVIKEMWPHADEHLYFATDHHWTQRGAYYAYRAFIHAKGEEIADLSEFPQDNVENFIGSWEYSLNGTPGESVLQENAETMERFMPIVEYKGDVFLDMNLTDRWRESKVIVESDNKYTTFIGGDMPIIRYKTNVKNGEKAVIIKESFGNAFATWAINNYEEVYIIDPRQWNGFGGASDRGEFNLVNFYNDVCQFDDLIVVSYPGSTTSNMRKAIASLVGM
ncbi:MAG: DHHW family protein [Clostridiales bacterium]|nr:DHHW family protein [Clostridiales bacterium]